MDLADARALWDPEPGWLNTASYGLPPGPPGTSCSRRSRCGGTARDELGAVGRVDRAGPPGVRPPRAGRADPGRHRRHGLRAARHGRGRRCRTARGSSSRRSSSPRTCSRGWCRRTAASRSSPSRPTGCSTRSRPGTTLVAISLVQSADRRDRRAGRDRRRGPGGRRARRRRRQPGGRLAAGRREPGRRVRLRRLQVADVAARHGVPRAVRAAAGAAAGRSTPAGTPAPTSTRRTTARRCGSRPTPAGSTSRRPGSAGWAPRRPSS